MLSKLLEHKVRKDIIRSNKKLNHRQYLKALNLQPKMKYWAGYHKKKLIFFGLVIIIGWTYELHVSLMHSLMSIGSPKQLLMHLFLGSQKVEATVNEQKIVGQPFQDRTLDLLTKLYYETDKELVFGVGRNYLFQVYSQMGLLQKPEEQAKFWRDGGFHKRRNQLVSGVGYKQFITLYSDGFKKLAKQNSQFSPEEYLKQFMTLFVQKGPQIQAWQKQFNRVRYSEYLKNLLTDDDKKSQMISNLMRQNLQISESELNNMLQASGMKGMGIKDRWTYWKNRQVLMSLRQYTLHKKLSLTIIEGRQRMEMERKLKDLEGQLSLINNKKKTLQQQYRSIYEQELI